VRACAERACPAASAQVRLFREEAPPAPPGEPSTTVDVDYERRIVAEAEARGGGAAGSSAASEALAAKVQVCDAHQHSSTATVAPRPDWLRVARVQAYAEAAERHVRAGVSAEDARLAVAMVGDDAAPTKARASTSSASSRGCV
jgi:hypothetical protein